MSIEINTDWHPEAFVANLDKESMAALEDAGELILKVWGNTIPHATGELESRLALTSVPSERKVIISSTGPQAIRQEFDDSLRHPDPTNPSSRAGRKAHAGRDALNNNRGKIAKFVQDRLK